MVPTSGRPHPPLSQGLSETSYGSDSIDLSPVELQVINVDNCLSFFVEHRKDFYKYNFVERVLFDTVLVLLFCLSVFSLTSYQLIVIDK